MRGAKTLYLFLAAVLLTTAGCANSKKPTVTFDPSADFTTIATFAWASDEPMLITEGGNPRIHNANNDGLIRTAIERELGARGVTKGEGEADVLVYFQVTTAEKVSVGGFSTAGGLTWTQENADRSYTQGTLLIGLFDARDRKQIWQGWTSRPLSPSDDPTVVINAAVAKILAGYPPGAETGAPADK